MNSVEQFIDAHQLPREFLSIANRYYQPLAMQLAKQAIGGNLRVLGISGAQGTGKSTLAKFLAQVLLQDFGLTVVCLSLDDFYLGKSERIDLARNIHPLLATRGVPGTHDIQLATKVIDELLAGGRVQIPRFDKSIDDRAVFDQSDLSVGRVDMVVLEGWCVGAKAQRSESLVEPINELERVEDPDGKWRVFYNDALGAQYSSLFSKLDYLVFLKAPSFDCIYQWRSEQEKKLRDKVGDGPSIMDAITLQRFIMHYERITRNCLTRLPKTADAVLNLDHAHTIDSLTYKNSY